MGFFFYFSPSQSLQKALFGVMTRAQFLRDTSIGTLILLKNLPTEMLNDVLFLVKITSSKFLNFFVTSQCPMLILGSKD